MQSNNEECGKTEVCNTSELYNTSGKGYEDITILTVTTTKKQSH